MSDLTYTLLGIDRASPAFDKVSRHVDRLADKLDGFGKISIIALGGVAAASASSGVAIGAALGGAALSFVALGVAAQSGNAQVQASFRGLTDEVRRDVTRMTEPMAPAITRSINKIGAAFNELEPLTARAFTASARHLDILTDSVTGFARNAMPGLVRAVEGADPALQGLRSLSLDVGAGLSGMLDELTRGSGAAGQVLGQLGSVLRTVLPMAGSLLRQLAEAGAGTFAQLGGAVVSVVSVVQQLSGGALPVLAAALNAAASVVNGVMTALGPMAGVLGTVTGGVLAFAAAWKVVSSVQDGITTIIGGIDRVRDRMTAATAGAGGFVGKLKGLAGTLGGPLGLAVTGVTIGLGLLGAVTGTSGEAAQRYAGFTEDLTAALRENKGVIDGSIRSQIAAKKETAEAIASARELGIASGQVVDAVMGQGDALQDLRTRLEGVAEANKLIAKDAETGLDVWMGGYNETGQKARELAQKLGDLKDGFAASIQAERDYTSATKGTSRSLLDASSSGKRFGDAIKAMNTELATGEEKAKSLLDALNALTGADISLEQSMAKVHDGLAKIGDEFGKNADKAQGWGQALVQADGHVNTVTANGRRLSDIMIGLRDSTTQAAMKTYDLAIAQGESVPSAMEKARKVTEDSRQGLIRQAGQLGLTRDQAEKLADQYDLVPDLVETIIKTPHLSDAQREILVLSQLIGAVPPGKSVRIQALSQEAQRMVEHFGLTVVRLKDGSVEITAKTEQAHREIANIPRKLTGTITFSARYQNLKGGESWGSAATRAMGGPVEAGRPYWVGEKGPELVFPDRSGFVATADESARILRGMDSGIRIGSGGAMVGATLPGRPFTAGGGGGMAVTINVNGAQEPVLVAEEIRRVLLQLKRDQGGAALGLA